MNMKMTLYELGEWGSENHLVTFSLRMVGVKGNSDNVTEYDVFYLYGIPKEFLRKRVAREFQ